MLLFRLSCISIQTKVFYENTTKNSQHYLLFFTFSRLNLLCKNNNDSQNDTLSHIVTFDLHIYMLFNLQIGKLLAIGTTHSDIPGQKPTGEEIRLV